MNHKKGLAIFLSIACAAILGSVFPVSYTHLERKNEDSYPWQWDQAEYFHSDPQYLR